MMLISLIKLNGFITILYGYGSNYQHDFSIRTLILIATIRRPDKRGLNNMDSLPHIVRNLKVNAFRLLNPEGSRLASLKSLFA